MAKQFYTRDEYLGGIVEKPSRMSFNEAINAGVKRVNKHTINGETKTNKAWFEYFNLKPTSARTMLSIFKGDMQKTLEYYKIDTSKLEITKFI